MIDLSGWQEQVLAATAAVCVKAGGPPIGTAVPIEPRRLLTCRQVVTADGTPDGRLLDGVTVTFPGRRFWGAKPLHDVSGVDAAVVELIAAIDGDDRAEEALPVLVRLSGGGRRPPRAFDSATSLWLVDAYDSHVIESLSGGGRLISSLAAVRGRSHPDEPSALRVRPA